MPEVTSLLETTEGQASFGTVDGVFTGENGLIHRMSPNYLEDDWGDNKLTNRDNDEHGTYEQDDGEILLDAAYRPEWVAEAGSLSDLTVSGGHIAWDGADFPDGHETIIRTPSQFTIGIFECDYQFITLGDHGDSVRLSLFTVDGSNRVQIMASDSGGGGGGNIYQLLKYNPSDTILINSTWSSDTNLHTMRATRDSGANYELFLDGVSEGTATDTFIPTGERKAGIYFRDSEGESLIEVSDLLYT